MIDSKQIAKSSERSPSMRNEERSRLTRQSLVDAARQVFVRDGFEKASLQHISTLAGKTRGAFYDHFTDKDDVFFAVIEQLLASSRGRFRQELKLVSTRAEGIAALSAHLVDVIEDRERALLALEFKMYVIRHPDEQKRLTALHAAVCLRGLIDIGELLPEISMAIGSIESRRQVAQLGAIVDGLSLNRLFDPGSLDSADLLKQAAAGNSRAPLTNNKTRRATVQSEGQMTSRTTTSSIRLPPKQFERVSRALAEPRRMQILKQLAGEGGEVTCGDLAAQHEISVATMSHHTKELKDAGLIDIRREGRFGYVSLNREVLRAFLDELSEI